MNSVCAAGLEPSVQAGDKKCLLLRFQCSFFSRKTVFFMHKPVSSFSSTAGLCWAICIDLVNKRPLAGSEAQTPWALKQTGKRRLRQAVAVPCYMQLYVYNIGVYVYTSIWSENIQYLQSLLLDSILGDFFLNFECFQNQKIGGTTDQIYACLCMYKNVTFRNPEKWMTSLNIDQWPRKMFVYGAEKCAEYSFSSNHGNQR